MLNPKDWVQVHVLGETQNWRLNDGRCKEEMIYFHLYENQFGDRKIDIHQTGYSDLYDSGKDLNIYQEHLRPWRDGLIEYSDVPSYWEVKGVEKPKKKKKVEKIKTDGNLIHYNFRNE